MVRFISAAVAAASLYGADAAHYQADVIVVGAGYSGLGAARTLKREGVDVMVLEGRNRVGGRTWVQEFQGKPYDMGGAWIVGGRWNPLHQIQAEYGLTPALTGDHHPIENQFSMDNEWLDWRDYERGPYKDYTDAVKNAKRSFGKSIYEAVEEGKKWDDVDQERFNSTMTHVTELDWAGTANEIDSQACVSFDQGFERAPSEKTATGKVYREDNYWPEKGFGGSTTTEGMADIIVREEGLNVQLEAIVDEIAQDGNQVTITTESGDVYTANRAIVTIPLGVLKAGDVRFTPNLSNSKKNAIDRLGFGTCNKLFMTFDEENFAGAPWADNMEYFAAEASREDQTSWFMNLQEHPIYGGVPVVGAWFCDSETFAFPGANDKPALLSRTLEVLRRMYPELGEPIDTMYSDWGNDRFARGSYSFPSVGSPWADRDALASRDGLLHFAGEHTTYCWGSVHGAFESGESAAAEVMRAKNKGPELSTRRPAEREGWTEEKSFSAFFGFPL